MPPSNPKRHQEKPEWSRLESAFFDLGVHPVRTRGVLACHRRDSRVHAFSTMQRPFSPLTRVGKKELTMLRVVLVEQRKSNLAHTKTLKEERDLIDGCNHQYSFGPTDVVIIEQIV